MFQVRESLGKDVEEVLKAEGVNSRAIVRRRDEVAIPIPPNVVPPERVGNFLGGIIKSIGVGANIVSLGQVSRA